MKMERNSLTVTPWEARRLANRLRGVAPLGFVPDDPDEETDPNDPDLLMCAASYLENGGTISVKGRDRAPVQPQEPPVETEHNPPHTLEPQAGNPMEPGRAKVRPEHPDVGLTADGPGDPDEDDDDKPAAKRRAAKEQDDAIQEREAEEVSVRKGAGSSREVRGSHPEGREAASARDQAQRKEQETRVAEGLHRPAKVEEVDNPLEVVRQQRARKK